MIDPHQVRLDALHGKLPTLEQVLEMCDTLEDGDREAKDTIDGLRSEHDDLEDEVARLEDERDQLRDEVKELASRLNQAMNP